MSDIVEGQIQYVQGSGKKPYELQLKGGVYSCSCPAWRNQSNPIDRRTCKHLRLMRGDAAETLRVSGFHAVGVTTSRTSSAVPNRSKEEVVLERLTAMKEEKPEEYAKLSSWVDGLPEPVDADYASIEQELVDKNPGLLQDPLGLKARILAEKERVAGRKLRPDEKTKLFGPPVLLAHPFEDADQDPTGWWMSEKLDGVRAYWDGKDFVSRQGNVFHAPAWFKDGLPDHPLDGELWIDRRSFQQTISIVKSVDAGERWKAVKYLAFDLPASKLPFEARQDGLERACIASTSKVLKLVAQTPCRDLPHLKAELDRIVAQGAEGLMIRKPGSLYEAGRSHTILKVKPWKDAEATVIGYEAGKGRHKGRIGGLVVKLDDDATALRPKGLKYEFHIGTGLSDEDRRNPPKIGSRITFRYMDVTDAGIPKGASFIATRDYE